MSIRIIPKKWTQLIRQVLTLLLLVLYTIGNSQREVIHVFAHDHEVSSTHSDAQGRGLHNKLICDDSDVHGCDRDSHVTIASEKCQMCDLVSHPDQNLLSGIGIESLQFLLKYFSTYKSNLKSYWAVNSSSRAPPILT